MVNANFRAWFQASRPPFFIATLAPLSLGAVLASRAEAFQWPVFGVILLASFLVHLCTNLANDYFDHLAGADAGGSIGGSRVLQEGKLSLKEIGWALVLLYGLAGALGLWLLWVTQVWWLAGVMVFSFLSSLFYTAPPVRYGWRSLGEVLVFINMGPVMVGGTFAALTGGVTPAVLMLSLPIGLMVALILYYQSLPDIETDRGVGKATIATRLSRGGARWLFRVMGGLALALLCAVVALKLAAPWLLCCLLSAALLWRVDRMIGATTDWQDLHGNGRFVRIFYLFNALVLILSVAWHAR